MPKEPRETMRLRPSDLIVPAVLCTVLLALFFQGWVLAEGRSRDLDTMALRAANRAQATANQVQGLFRQTDLLLLDLREHLAPGAERQEPAALQPLLRAHLARIPQLSALHVLDAEGRLVASSQAPPLEPGPTERQGVQAQRMATEDQARLSAPLLDQATQRWGIQLTRRLTAPDGRFLGVLAATLDTDRVGESLVAVDLQQWTLALYDTGRRLVARTPSRQPGLGEAVGNPSTDPILQAWIQRGKTRFRSPGLGERSPQLWALQPVEGLPLVAAAGFSEARALAQWRSDLRINLAVAAMLVAGCAVVLVLHRRSVDAHRQLHAREAYFRTLFDASPEAIAVVEAGPGESRVVDVNLRYREMFHIPEAPDPLLPWERAPQKQPDGSHSAEKGRRLCRMSQAGELQRLPWQCQREDDSRFDAEFTMFSFRHGSRDLLITVIRDLTELRDMEEKLHQAQKLDALGQLAGGVAHDFNNMLSAILASAEVMAERASGESERRLCGTIISASERAGQLTRKLLAFARKGKILSTPLDAHQVLHETVALLERTIDRRIEIVTRLEAERATLVGDPAQLQNALLNLGVNARDAMPEGGRITFSSENVHLAGPHCQVGSFRLEEGEYLHLCVADTGCGIPEAHLQRIFDPFFTTKDVGMGTGLGLAAVFGAMASHRGAVAVGSRVGEGSLFHLYLPLMGQDQPAEAPAALPAPRGSGTVLVIDDEDFVRTAITLQIESLGYRVESTGDPVQGLAYFRESHDRLSAVLLDVVMPRLSGRELALELRRIAPGVPIVLMSGFPRSTQVGDLLEGSVSAFLQKPFNRQELAQTLARLCANRPSPGPADPPR
jgi:signal transduction histidine kinase/CheY-like chemotaxis protein